MTEQDVLRLDAEDPLAPLRARFAVPEGVTYLDGNSLGPPLHTARAAMDAVIAEQWGADLIASWNTHDWIGLPQRVGARIAPLVGGAADEVIVSDSVSVNLFKLIAAVCLARPHRRTILTEPGNFPTDLYIAQGVAGMLADRKVRTEPAEAIIDAIDHDTALVLLTHVHYKSGRRHDMAAIAAAAHAKGTLVLWDLSHSAGAVAIDLAGCQADLAVGCGYKFFNGGPGAPGFLYVARRLQGELQSPLAGWMGHAAPFDFDDGYRPAEGMQRFLCGTPPILAMAALDHALSVFDGIDMGLVEHKALALGDMFLELVEVQCGAFGFDLASPRERHGRGAHISFAHPQAYAICQALIARRVVGDFRAPDLLRMGFAPLTTRFIDVWRTVGILHDVMATGAWADPIFAIRQKVT
ncbi:kynureninase [Novosphingobium sp.]|uniref:kynureninase n=1 Tax=Novosphingobium sp. TaxID=1874826 RepID=UPI0025EE846F|nr:kynureninase [Novosphingobium sp.]